MRRLGKKGRDGVAAPRRSGGGTLVTLAGFFIVSAMLRFGVAAADAFSATETHEGPSEKAAACTTDGDALALFEEVKTREARVAEREKRAEDRDRALTLASTTIDDKLKTLEEAEAKLAATLAIADKAADKDVASLIAVYEKMKPKDAARLFEQMPPEFAAGFLSGMRPDSAAAVMAGLDPEKAYSISVVLAGRNARAPKS